MSMFDGLFGYEKAMLVLGVLLFLLLAALLIVQASRGKPFAAMLPAFALPIVMIGYPSVKKITIGKDSITLEKTTHALLAAPTNSAVRTSLATQVAGLAHRPTADPAVLTNIAAAQFALGHSTQAQATLAKAVDAAPALPAAVQLQQRIDFDKALATLTARLAHHPDDATRKELSAVLAQTAPLKISSPIFLDHIASAHAVLGERAKAQIFAGQALRIDPNLPDAIQMKALAAGPGMQP